MIHIQQSALGAFEEHLFLVSEPTVSAARGSNREATLFQEPDVILIRRPVGHATK